ncbi:MAG: Cysteine desulfurase [Pelotomaculum sp. PtaB.Bin013]|nr:MAG: Cysteine desulfurase [Pelotomaculum sp. PtaB.Bin013]
MISHLEHLEKIRQNLPATQNIVYMNTGATGPLPVTAIQAVQEAQQAELYNGRINKEVVQLKKRAKLETRQLLAELIKANNDEIVLTRNTTEGINLIISGIKWQPEDEVITTNIEHAAVLLPLFLLNQRYGVSIKTARVDGNPLRAFKELISPHTRLIAISHVSYSTGELLPIQEIAQLAHQHGIPVLIDGAQAVGAIPVDISELGVDFYSFSGQKWLCGPEGTGALYIRQERLNDLHPAYIGYASVEHFDPEGSFSFHSTARRFEFATTNTPSLLGQGASIRWLTEYVGLDWAFDRIKTLHHLTRQELATVTDVTVLTPAAAAGLISFQLNGVEPQQLVKTLASQGIIIRTIKELNCVRASIGFFNTEEEVECLVKAVRQARRKACSHSVCR